LLGEREEKTVDGKGAWKTENDATGIQRPPSSRPQVERKTEKASTLTGRKRKALATTKVLATREEKAEK